MKKCRHLHIFDFNNCDALANLQDQNDPIIKDTRSIKIEKALINDEIQ